MATNFESEEMIVYGQLIRYLGPQLFNHHEHFPGFHMTMKTQDRRAKLAVADN
jgi:hypothetical protein